MTHPYDMCPEQETWTDQQLDDCERLEINIDDENAGVDLSVALAEEKADINNDIQNDK